MWMIYAIGSAIFAGITSILAKIGIKNTDSTLATAIRTSVIVVFSWLLVYITNVQSQISEIDTKTLVFLILSGFATGASWLCYFKALQLGDINKVVPIDKSSTVLTIILAFLFLQEGIRFSKVIAVICIALGIACMIEKKDVQNTSTSSTWMLYAIGSAIFASLTAILGKIGISGVDSNLGTAIRTIIVFIMAWMMVIVTKKTKEVRKIDRKEFVFICLSGIATGASWLFYYRALQIGVTSVVVCIDKLSVLVTVTFSFVVFHEKLSKKAMLGLLLLTSGTIALAML